MWDALRSIAEALEASEPVPSTSDPALAEVRAATAPMPSKGDSAHCGGHPTRAVGHGKYKEEHIRRNEREVETKKRSGVGPWHA